MSKLLLSAAITIVLTWLVVERLDGRMSAANQVAAKSAKTLDDDCKKGDAVACFDLAFRYQQGEGVGENQRRALVLYEKACTGGVVAGCVNAAFIYELGDKGVATNTVKALGLFRAICDGPDHDVQGNRPHKIACDGVKRLGSAAGATPARRDRN